MTQNEIIEMARQVGYPIQHPEWQKATEEFAALVEEKVAAKEREACAILCDNRSSFYWNWQEGNLQKHEENRHYAKASEECADAIRARGEQA